MTVKLEAMSPEDKQRAKLEAMSLDEKRAHRAKRIAEGAPDTEIDSIESSIERDVKMADRKQVADDHRASAELADRKRVELAQLRKKIAETKKRLNQLPARAAKVRRDLIDVGRGVSEIREELSDLTACAREIIGPTFSTGDHWPNIEHGTLHDLRRSEIPTRGIPLDPTANGVERATANAAEALIAELNQYLRSIGSEP